MENASIIIVERLIRAGGRLSGARDQMVRRVTQASVNSHSGEWEK